MTEAEPVTQAEPARQAGPVTHPGLDEPAAAARPAGGAPAIPTLSRSRHDRAAERRNDADWLASAWSTAAVLPVSPEGTVPVRPAEDAAGGKSGVTPARQVPAWTAATGAERGDRLFLGQANGRAYFAVLAPGQNHWVSLREFGADVDELEAGLLTSAVALAHWHARHTHCPRCGAQTAISQAGWSRRCPLDGSQHFPRTDPAVIMLVHDGGDKCVLGRQASWPVGRFSILAGFVEAGESAETAVAREVYEEAGLRITDIRYRSSQPWPFPASLMLGFTALAVDDLAITRHDSELAEAGWFSRAEVAAAATWSAEGTDSTTGNQSRLQAIPGGISIARFLLDEWLAAGPQ